MHQVFISQRGYDGDEGNGEGYITTGHSTKQGRRCGVETDETRVDLQSTDPTYHAAPSRTVAVA